MITQATRYALIGLLHLARAAPAIRSAPSIAREEKMPLKFLQNLLVELRHAGLVKSTTGVLGGYALARAPEAISVGDIVEALGDRQSGLGRSNRMQTLSSEAADRVETFLLQARERMLSELAQISLADLLANDVTFGLLRQRNGPLYGAPPAPFTNSGGVPDGVV